MNTRLEGDVFRKAFQRFDGGRRRYAFKNVYGLGLLLKRLTSKNFSFLVHRRPFDFLRRLRASPITSSARGSEVRRWSSRSKFCIPMNFLRGFCEPFRCVFFLYVVRSSAQSRCLTEVMVTMYKSRTAKSSFTDFLQRSTKTKV